MQQFNEVWWRFAMFGKLCATFIVFGVLAVISIDAHNRLRAADSVLDALELHQKSNSNGEAAFSWDQQAYRDLGKRELANLPIGVFDSGIGGLTVLEALLTADLFDNVTRKPSSDGRPDFVGEQFIYLGDQANMPYGNYPAQGRTEYLRELILKDAIFLLGKRYHERDPGGISSKPCMNKPPVKAIVIACNTATAYGLEDICTALKRWDLPVVVVGVVEAGARELEATPGDGAVGVLATVGTCDSRVYPRMIKSTFDLKGRPQPIVTQHGCVRLANEIEDPDTDSSVREQIAIDVRALVDDHRDKSSTASVPAPPLKKIMLGCTHYPLVLSELRTAFAALRAQPGYALWISDELQFVNPAESTARELFGKLTLADLRRGGKTEPDQGSTPRADFFISIAHDACPDVKLIAPGKLDDEYKYNRLPGRLNVEDTVVVPMTRSLLPEANRKLLQKKLRTVWKLLPES